MRCSHALLTALARRSAPVTGGVKNPRLGNRYTRTGRQVRRAYLIQEIKDTQSTIDTLKGDAQWLTPGEPADVGRTEAIAGLVRRAEKLQADLAIVCDRGTLEGN